MSDDFGRPTAPIITISNPRTIIGKPLPDCPTCLGKGYVISAQAVGTSARCTCTLKDFGTQYLTPAFVNEPMIKDLDYKQFERKNLFIKSGARVWRQFVKSYLLKSGAQHSFALTAPRHIITAKLSRIEEPQHNAALLEPDILIIQFAFDPPNNGYGAYIASVIHDRINAGKFTWIVSQHDYTTDEFRKVYDTAGQHLGPTIRNHFAMLPLSAAA